MARGIGRRRTRHGLDQGRRSGGAVPRVGTRENVLAPRGNFMPDPGPARCTAATASASRGRGRGGLWALGIVCVAAAGTVYWVHHSQKEERRVPRPYARRARHAARVLTRAPRHARRRCARPCCAISKSSAGDVKRRADARPEICVPCRPVSRVYCAVILPPLIRAATVTAVVVHPQVDYARLAL